MSGKFLILRFIEVKNCAILNIENKLLYQQHRSKTNKKKMIFLGICLTNKPDKIVGVAEIFDYDSAVNMITIGYRLNDRFWGQGIATKAVSALLDYLFNEIGINRIQAFVMPENIKSLNVLERNHFLKEGVIRQGHIWKGKGVVDLIEFSMLKSDYTK